MAITRQVLKVNDDFQARMDLQIYTDWCAIRKDSKRFKALKELIALRKKELAEVSVELAEEEAEE